MEFRVLGPLEAVAEGRVVALDAAKPRALLAILLLHANEPVGSDRLVEDLWAGRPPATAAKVLQTYVSQLRKALGNDVIVTMEFPFGVELFTRRNRHMDARVQVLNRLGFLKRNGSSIKKGRVDSISRQSQTTSGKSRPCVDVKGEFDLVANGLTHGMELFDRSQHRWRGVQNVAILGRPQRTNFQPSSLVCRQESTNACTSMHAPTLCG